MDSEAIIYEQGPRHLGDIKSKTALEYSELR